MKPSDLVLRLRTHAHMEHVASSWGFSRSGMVMELAADLIEQQEAALRDATCKRGLEEALEIANRGYEYVEGVIHGIKERLAEISDE